ncbi:hypothetical protein KC343_g10866 [Hortaea werneckii]|nr:hypothetical protein KC317_g12726 [Hortaea werneckii]KAI7601880.1 hypothetical protein KC346_g12605 [Hortaea werneckii]KAI7613480.1 hypothetical protein KC343_g10866 [Hortaea werneckii]KAI7643858.1 hypothetical protein KC319_g12500 [Hortaea werneckii]KAI7673829.1 hypothetical protein KC322_g15711 [Hortaea werneckii]
MADTDDGRYFDFLGLSLELRDAIYDELLNDNNMLPTRDTALYFLAKGLVDTSLLLVSRSFHDELKKRAEKALHVTIQEYGRVLPDSYETEFPPLLLRVRSLTLQLWVGCHGGHPTDDSGECYELQVDLEILHELAESVVQSTPRLERLRVDLHRPDLEACDHAVCNHTLATRVESFFSVMEALELRVYRVPAEFYASNEPNQFSFYYVKPMYTNYEYREGPIAKWNHATKALEDVGGFHEKYDAAEDSDG